MIVVMIVVMVVIMVMPAFIMLSSALSVFHRTA